MRVRVEYPVNAGDEWRRAIVRYYSNDEKRSMSDRKATRDEIVDWLFKYGRSMDDDVISECGDDS